MQDIEQRAEFGETGDVLIDLVMGCLLHGHVAFSDTAWLESASFHTLLDGDAEPWRRDCFAELLGASHDDAPRIAILQWDDKTDGVYSSFIEKMARWIVDDEPFMLTSCKPSAIRNDPSHWASLEPETRVRTFYQACGTPEALRFLGALEAVRERRLDNICLRFRTGSDLYQRFSDLVLSANWRLGQEKLVEQRLSTIAIPGSVVTRGKLFQQLGFDFFKPEPERYDDLTRSLIYQGQVAYLQQFCDTFEMTKSLTTVPRDWKKRLLLDDDSDSAQQLIDALATQWACGLNPRQQPQGLLRNDLAARAKIPNDALLPLLTEAAVSPELSCAVSAEDLKRPGGIDEHDERVDRLHHWIADRLAAQSVSLRRDWLRSYSRQKEIVQATISDNNPKLQCLAGALALLDPSLGCLVFLGAALSGPAIAELDLLVARSNMLFQHALATKMDWSFMKRVSAQMPSLSAMVANC